MHLFDHMAQLLAGRVPFVTATVVDTGGSAPQKPGARLVLATGGKLQGTIGGGAIELQILEACEELLADSGRTTRLFKTHLTHDLGMCCGGSMTVFLEKVLPAERLFIYGAGHVAKPLAALAKTVGFEVEVIDERAEWLTGERFPTVVRTLRHPVDAARALSGDARTFCCVTTHDHKLDQELAEALLRKPLAYLGVIGSLRKREKFRQRLGAAGFSEKELSRMRTPMGMPIGAQSPEEIAVSIVGELVAVRRGVELAAAPAGVAAESESA